MTKFVQTVLGPVSVDDLGFTLMHEHLKFAVPGWDLDPTLTIDREKDIAETVEHLNRAKKLGVRTLVDVSPMEIRDAPFIQEVSRRRGMHIICATGLYYQPMPSKNGPAPPNHGFPCYFAMLNADRIAQFYEAELREGIGKERVLPGIIKAFIGNDQIGDDERKALQAAAKAAVQTGARVTTHTPGAMGEEQLDILTAEGLAVHHILIGHCDRSKSLEYQKKILRRGCYIGFDVIGHDGICPDELRVEHIAALVKEGYVRQLVLSHDANVCAHMMPDDIPVNWRASLSPTSPKRRYTYLVEGFIPMLLAAGVTKQDVHTMTVENPRRYFAGEPFK